MYPELSLYEAIVWQDTQHNVFSIESIARRMLVLNAPSCDICEILDIPYELLLEYEKNNMACFNRAKMLAKLINENSERQDGAIIDNLSLCDIFADYSTFVGMAKVMGLSQTQYAQLCSYRFDKD